MPVRVEEVFMECFFEQCIKCMLTYFDVNFKLFKYVNMHI